MHRVVKKLDNEREFSVTNLTHEELGYKGLRIALSPNFRYYEIDTQVQSVMENAVKVFEFLGCVFQPTVCLLECR